MKIGRKLKYEEERSYVGFNIKTSVKRAFMKKLEEDGSDMTTFLESSILKYINSKQII